MQNDMDRFRGTRRILAIFGSNYFMWVGIGLMGTAALLVFAAVTNEWGLIPIAVAIFVMITYVALAWLWAVYLRYDAGDLRPAAWIGRMSRISPQHDVLVIDLGERQLAIDLIRYLTIGKCTVVDIYNPQIFRHRDLQKWRRQKPPAIGDQRIVWRTGMFDLLPARDKSQDIVVIPNVLGELDQLGDQDRILNEAYRVLKPGGYLVVSEPIASATNILLLHMQAFRYKSAEFWRKRIDKTDFARVKRVVVNDVMVYISAQKVEQERGVQLSLLRESQFTPE